MASDTFLQIDGIKGESTDADHKDWIEIFSFDWNVKQKASGSASSAGGASTQRADFDVLTITKELDSSSPLLNKACWGGQHIAKVVLQLNRAAGDKRQKYMQYELQNVMICHVEIHGSGGGVPIETVKFDYGKIITTYTKQARAGGGGAGEIPAGWDRQANKHC